MSEKNFSKSSLICPRCNETLMTYETQTHEWSKSGGLTTRKGPRVCVGCHAAVDLSVAIGMLELREKEAEIRRLQEQVATGSKAYGLEVNSGKSS